MRNPTQENSNFKNSHSHTTENRPRTPWQTQLYLDPLRPPPPPSGEKDPRMTLTVACYTLVVTQWTCMRNGFFGMNREIMKHSSMVKTVEGTNPCQFARPPCPLPASRCMGIARTRCRGDR